MFLLFVVSLFALLASAGPLNGSNASSGLRWTGEVAGHGLVTLYGTVDSVEEQLFALHPPLRESYVITNPFMSPTPRPLNETEMVVSNLSYSYKPAEAPAGRANLPVAGRADVDPGVSVDQGYGETHWYCGNFATGSYEEAFEAVARLNAPGGVTGGQWAVPAAKKLSPLVSTCARLVCAVSNGQPAHTAVYWCNDKGEDVVAPASVLSSVAAMVAGGYDEFRWTGCCLSSQNRGAHNQYSGQVFIGNGTNVVVGWGDCSSDDYFVAPNTYAVPGDYGACI